MRTTIDEAGRLVIPKSSREAIGIQGRQEVEIQIRDGRLEIEVPFAPMHLEEHKAWLWRCQIARYPR